MEATVFKLLMLQKIYYFEPKNSEIKNYTLFLGNISKNFTINMKKRNWEGLELFFF